MAPERAESDFGQQGWIDTLGLKQIFSIFSEVLHRNKLGQYSKIVVGMQLTRVDFHQGLTRKLSYYDNNNC